MSLSKIFIPLMLTLILWVALSGWIPLVLAWSSQEYESDLMLIDMLVLQNDLDADQAKGMSGEMYLKLILLRLALSWIAVLTLILSIFLVKQVAAKME